MGTGTFSKSRKRASPHFFSDDAAFDKPFTSADWWCKTLDLILIRQMGGEMRFPEVPLEK